MTQQQEAEFAIDYDGVWYHDGARIERKALAKLFADKGLKRDEAGDYWLQSPFEKYPVKVKDVPFVAVDYKECDGCFDLITNMEEVVELGPGHPLELRDGIPYVEVRDGLYARVGRAIYYHLIENYGGAITSRGAVYALGELDERELGE